MKKKCSKCKAEKETSEFAKIAYSKDGLNSWCRECSSKSSKALKQKKNKEQQDFYNMFL